MAEIRKFDPDAGEGIARLVREAMGESIRPVEPGSPKPELTPEPDEPDEPDADTGPAASWSWDESGPTFQF
ncbi:hypothetical protein LKO27_08875 [Tessaracoccus sp. OS52]|uniref:hypothetical protein n=1 Tax=Tessaracoccus sp. OS52 TaxID=2886691 RepID=UPI001D113E05|nr:hypothetical protein [Tessaracoccus sp. OS52]MCC2593520.1 hypothetical protein [Tessaracoccus sp. OS52]